MEKKIEKTNLKKKFKDLAGELLVVVAGSGVAAVVDYIPDQSLNYPFYDLAAGAGFAQGLGAPKKEISYTGIAMYGVSLLDDVMKYGVTENYAMLGAQIVKKTLVYGLGAFVGAVLSVVGEKEGKEKD